MKINYQLELDKILSEEAGTRTPGLLLHSCCAPCSSYVLEYLSGYFNITVLYFNPNIYPYEEYLKRLGTQERLIASMNTINPIRQISVDYDPQEFYEAVAGVECEPEGGFRCEKCYELRLEKTAKLAKAYGFDYFTTTLTLSPHKDSQLINKLGGKIASKYDIKYLFSDFKKRGGYKRSIELSELFGLYRQNYCGCKFSIRN